MKISRIADSFDLYRIEASHAELTAIRSRLAGEETGVISDEILQAMTWYMDNLPKPGEDPKKKGDDGLPPADVDASDISVDEAPPEKKGDEAAANELAVAAGAVGDEELPSPE